MDLLIDPDFSMIGPEADIELLEIDGVDGDIATDNQRLKGVTRPIPVYVDVDNNQLAQRAHVLSNWLKADTGWHDFELSDSPDFIYRAMYYEEFHLQKTILQYSRAILSFRFKPYKFYKSGLNEIELTNGQRINNIGTRPSRPLIRLTGSGNMTLTIGDQTIQLQGVQDGIVIDVLDDIIFNLNRTRREWDKLFTYPFPKIPVGESTISWTGATSVRLIPRWEALLP